MEAAGFDQGDKWHRESNWKGVRAVFDEVEEVVACAQRKER